MSKDKINRIVDLLLKDRKGQLAETERLELKQWINENRDLYLELTNDKGMLDEIQMDSQSVRRAFAVVQKRIPALQEASDTKPAKVYALRPWRWAAVAAAMLVIAVGGFYFRANRMRQQTKAGTSITTAENAIIVPGSNKATLALSNGSVIQLNGADNGKLAQDGNVEIQKINGGLLAYKISIEKPTIILYNTLSTPTGGQFQLVLPDGTKVWLNNASTLTYPVQFPARKREVDLEGEAYFEVAHITEANGDRTPFIVHVKPLPGQKDGTTIEDIGTHFNVNAYADENIEKTSLLEGAIRVQKGNRSFLVKPGEQFQSPIDEEKASVIKADVDMAVSWKNGIFQYKETSVREVMKQLARWYDVAVEYGSGDLSRADFTGKIRRQDSVQAFLRMIELTGSVHFKIEGKKIVVNN